MTAASCLGEATQRALKGSTQQCPLRKTWSFSKGGRCQDNFNESGVDP